MKILKSKNGLPVVFKRVSGNLVDIKYYVRCGSRDEKIKEHHGLAHAVEHMMFQGTTNKDWQEIVREYRGNGCYYNAETDFEHTLYHVQCVKDYFEDSFSTLVNMFYSSIFPEERWGIEQQTILAEIADAEDDPNQIFGECIFKHLFGASYHNILGDVNNIRTTSVDNLVEFKEQYYKGKNVFLVIAGDIDEKSLLQIVDRHDRWENKPVLDRGDFDCQLNTRKVTFVSPKIDQILGSFVRPIRTHDKVRDEIALDIGLDLLYNYLYEDLVYSKGLGYHVGASHFNAITGGDLLTIDFTCLPENSERLIEEIPKVIYNFLETGITSSAVEEARRSYLRMTHAVEADIDNITRWLGSAYLQGKTKKDPFEETYEGIRKIKDRTIRNIITDCLTVTPKLAMMVGE